MWLETEWNLVVDSVVVDGVSGRWVDIGSSRPRSFNVVVDLVQWLLVVVDDVIVDLVVDWINLIGSIVVDVAIDLVSKAIIEIIVDSTLVEVRVDSSIIDV